MTKSFKKQTIAVSSLGQVILMDDYAFGYFEQQVLEEIDAVLASIPAGIYVVDILFTEEESGRKGIDLDVCYQLAEYRDKELYSGEVKLT